MFATAPVYWNFNRHNIPLLSKIKPSTKFNARNKFCLNTTVNIIRMIKYFFYLKRFCWYNTKSETRWIILQNTRFLGQESSIFERSPFFNKHCFLKIPNQVKSAFFCLRYALFCYFHSLPLLSRLASDQLVLFIIR